MPFLIPLEVACLLGRFVVTVLWILVEVWLASHMVCSFLIFCKFIDFLGCWSLRKQPSESGIRTSNSQYHRSYPYTLNPTSRKKNWRGFIDESNKKPTFCPRLLALFFARSRKGDFAVMRISLTLDLRLLRRKELKWTPLTLSDAWIFESSPMFIMTYCHSTILNGSYNQKSSEKKHGCLA